jgi:hypothetical protein
MCSNGRGAALTLSAVGAARKYYVIWYVRSCHEDMNVLA